jgi:hypothetical protein
LENICHLELQCVNDKSGYTSFRNWMESTVKMGSQHFNAVSGVIPIEN